VSLNSRDDSLTNFVHCLKFVIYLISKKKKFFLGQGKHVRNYRLANLKINHYMCVCVLGVGGGLRICMLQ